MIHFLFSTFTGIIIENVYTVYIYMYWLIRQVTSFEILDYQQLDENDRTGVKISFKFDQ